MGADGGPGALSGVRGQGGSSVGSDPKAFGAHGATLARTVENGKHASGLPILRISTEPEAIAL
jgi:hypothetical protein